VDRLVQRGDDVVGVDNFDPFYSPQEKRANLSGALGSGRFELIESDIAEPRRLAAALGSRTFDVVLHMAAKAGVRPSIADPLAYARANVLGTQSVLNVAKDLRVSRFVFASSSSVYGNSSSIPFTETDPVAFPVSPYAATKRAGELLCCSHQHLNGGSMICLRFFTVYGPRQRPDLAIRKFSALIAAGRPIPLFGDGSTERDYTWIDDIAEGVIAAVDRGAQHPQEYQVVNLGGSRATSLRRLVELLGGAFGTEPAIERLPAQPGDVERTWANVAKARELLGYAPRVTIEEGIPRFVDWFRRISTT
jgi:UDP-glucuronate 4-epimerase